MPPDLGAVNWRHARAFNGSSTIAASTSSFFEETSSASKEYPDTGTQLPSSMSSNSNTSTFSSTPLSSPSATRTTSSASTFPSSWFKSSSSRTFTKRASTSNSLTMTSVSHSRSTSGSSSPNTESGKRSFWSCSLRCDSSSEWRQRPTSVIILTSYATQFYTSTIPFTTLYPYTSGFMPSSSSHSHSTTHSTSSILPSSSGILSTNSPDGNTSFSRNTGAIIGVAIAAATFLISLTIVLFFVCRRLRRRQKNIGSSNSTRYLTSGLGGSDSLRSPIDGDDVEAFSGPYGDILAVMHLPQSTPGDMTYAPHSDEISQSYEHSSMSSHNQSIATRMQQKDEQLTPVAFPVQIEPGSHDNTPHLISYPATSHSSYTTMPASSANGGIKSDPLRSRASSTSYYATPRSPLTPLPARTAPELVITVDPPVRNSIPWLHRLSSSTFHLRGGTNGSSRSAGSRDDSPTRVPDGLLHPLLAQRIFTQPGSARSFLDNVDYSRPISGVHTRVDSITTFTTQGTAEADLGHEPDPK